MGEVQEEEEEEEKGRAMVDAYEVRLTNTDGKSPSSHQGFEGPPSTRGRFPVVVDIGQRHVALQSLYPKEQDPSLSVGRQHQYICQRRSQGQ